MNTPNAEDRLRLVRLISVPPLLGGLFLAMLVWLWVGVGQDAQSRWQVERAQKERASLNYDTARALLLSAVRLSAGDSDAWTQRGIVARTLWLFRGTPVFQQEADAAFERAARLNPHGALAHYEHARMYVFKGDYARAITLLQPALRLDPNNAGYWLEQARAQDRLGDASAARASFTRCAALALNPECEQGIQPKAQQ